MIAVNSIGYRLYTLCASDPVLITSAYVTALGDPIYPDQVQGPRITIQPEAFKIAPGLMQALTSGAYRGSVGFNLFHTYWDAQCSANIFLRLMQFEDQLTSMVASNPLLDGLVDNLESMEAAWHQYDPDSSDIAQVRVITLRYTVRG